jgi:predicted nucleotidyltransferase
MKTVRQEIEESRESIDALVHKHRGISAPIFGSVARGEETANSDIDFLVE